MTLASVNKMTKTRPYVLSSGTVFGSGREWDRNLTEKGSI